MMNKTPAANKRWHKSLLRLKLCSHCQQAFWQQGLVCPVCRRPLKEIHLPLMNLSGRVKSFTYFPLTIERKGEINHLRQTIVLAEFKIKNKGKVYTLFLNLPLAGFSKEQPNFGDKVKVTLRRRLDEDKDQPLLYLPKVILEK